MALKSTTISFWDHEGNAQAFNAGGYPQVLEVLEEMLDGIPYVKTFKVLSSTCHSARPTTQSCVLRVTLLPDARSGPFAFRSCETNM